MTSFYLKYMRCGIQQLIDFLAIIHSPLVSCTPAFASKDCVIFKASCQSKNFIWQSIDSWIFVACCARFTVHHFQE